MNEPMTHHEIEELLGAYALDAVDGNEAEIIELHLRDCVRCRSEVAEHREMASLLAHSGTSAPEGLWDRIAGEIDASVPGPPPLRFPTERRRTVPRVWAGALAVAAAIIAVLGFQVVRLDNKVNEIPAALSGDRVDQAAQAALLNPDSIRIRLEPFAPTGIPADAVVLPDGRGYLIMRDQPKLPFDRTYQLWGVTSGGTVSLGVLGASPNVIAFSAAGDLKALAVSIEKAGGVVTSEVQPALIGTVPGSA